MIKKPAEAVCVLTPYRDALDEREPLSRQVNAHLRAMKYAGGEGDAAFVFVNGETVTVQTFRMSSRLRIIPHHEGVPRNFRSVDCTRVARALVTKVDSFVPALILREER